MNSLQSPFVIVEEMIKQAELFGLEKGIAVLGDHLNKCFDVNRVRIYSYSLKERAIVGFMEYYCFNSTFSKLADIHSYVEDSDLPSELKPGSYDFSNKVQILNLNTYNNDNAPCKYAIRIQLFSDGEYECRLGIVTNDERVCKETEWLLEVCSLFGESISQSFDLKGTFSGTSSSTNFISMLKMCVGLNNIVNQIATVAPTNVSVLIEGETGVGKEYVARAIHELSKNPNGPLVTINCGAIPETLIDSILFGHEKGAFTGAYSRSAGLFEQAQGGTIFLDEIGELPMQSQVRLLRVLEYKTIQRLGGIQQIPLNTRIVAATNRSLIDMVHNKEFREDLYYRLSKYIIHVPALRERKIDINILINHYISQKQVEYNYDNELILLKSERNKLINYDWPGNVRELENVIDRGFIRNLTRKNPKELIIDLPEEVINIKKDSDVLSSVFSIQDLQSLEDLINSYILHVMDISKGKIYGAKGAAKLLDMHPNTLRSRLEKINWLSKTSKK